MTNANVVDSNMQISGSTIEVRVQADNNQLPMLRALAAIIPIQNNFDLDTVADMKLAMDEVCSYLIRYALPNSQLVCHFQQEDDTLQVAVTASTTEPINQNPGQFSWRILSVLTDTFTTSQEQILNPHNDSPTFDDNPTSDNPAFATTLKFTKKNSAMQ